MNQLVRSTKQLVKSVTKNLMRQMLKLLKAIRVNVVKTMLFQSLKVIPTTVMSIQAKFAKADLVN